MARAHFSLGFTLIELIVVVGILGILISVVILTFDPFGQLSKGKDALRMNDLTQVKTALDSFYSDKNCYPQVDEVSFGSSFSDPNNPATLYMRKLPQDPEASATRGYRYSTDTSSSCPQWNVIFAELSRPQNESVSCKLPVVCGTVLPSNYADKPRACIISGEIDCAFVASLVL